MAVSSRARAALLFAAGALFAGCSFVADFDESKIPGQEPDASGGGAIASTGGGASTGGSGGSGGSGVRPDPLAGGAAGAGGIVMGGGGTGGSGPPPTACDVETNQGCAKDEICCKVGQDATCKKTSIDECEACGVACPDVLSVACVARRCECAPGSGRACSGQASEQFCVAGSTTACAECRDATDCAARTDGKSRCVSGKCAVCDPTQNNAGCAGNTPICAAATLTCKACTASPDDCPGALVCTASGACGGCASAANCVTPTLPICDPATTQCRNCGSNAECTAQTGKPFCAGFTCGSCTPAGDVGCNDSTKPDCRGALGGGLSCQACINGQSCTGRAGTPVCDVGTGRCVACADDNDCSGNPSAPLCVNHSCVSCEAASTVPALADLRCALKAGGEPACIRSGAQRGECGACDPGGSRGCNQNQLCCEGSRVAACVANTLLTCTACSGGSCNPLLANACSNRGCRCGTGAACTGSAASQFCVSGACRECRTDTDCGTAAEPLCEGNVCVPCDQASSANVRCAAEVPGTVCAGAGAFAGRCAACDPLTHTGCGTGTLNQCNPATSTCVDCVDDGGCSGTLGQCNVAARTCVDCMDDNGCSGTLDQCNGTTHACVDCDATGGCSVASLPICDASACRGCQTDAECAGHRGAAGPLCATTGACVLDSPCTSNGDCTDANHPICEGLGVGGGVGVCRLCDPVSGAGCGAAQTCTAQFVCTP